MLDYDESLEDKGEFSFHMQVEEAGTAKSWGKSLQQERQRGEAKKKGRGEIEALLHCFSITKWFL